jgi:hypothetical protein
VDERAAAARPRALLVAEALVASPLPVPRLRDVLAAIVIRLGSVADCF